MNLDQLINSLVGAVILAVTTAMTWLVRTVLTNQKQIAMLQEEISSRDGQRQEDREVWKELKDDVKDLRKEILDIHKKN